MNLAAVYDEYHVTLSEAQKYFLESVMNGRYKLWFNPKNEHDNPKQRINWTNFRKLFNIHKSWFPGIIKASHTPAILAQARVVKPAPSNLPRHTTSSNRSQILTDLENLGEPKLKAQKIATDLQKNKKSRTKEQPISNNNK